MGTGTRVTRHYLEYNNIKYFRTKSEDVRLGSYGERKDPVGAIAYLAVQNHIKNEHLVGHVLVSAPIGINWLTAADGDSSSAGKLTFFSISGEGTSTASYREADQGNLKLIKVSITEGALQRVLNQDAAAARNFLEEEGADGRVVSSVFLIIDAEISEAFAASKKESGSITAALTSALGLSLSAENSQGVAGVVRITPAVGSAFAYGLHKVDEWNPDRTRVEGLEDDRKGMG